MTKVETNKAREKREELEEDEEDQRAAAKEGHKTGKSGEVEPLAVSDVAPGFTAGPVPAAKDISKIVLDTTTYGTETPPRQTPPTSIENFMKHSPPSFHDSNGAKIASLAPTLGSISPNTAVAVTGADLTVTATGTNIDRATFMTSNGAILTNTQWLTTTTCSAVIRPALNVPGVMLVRVQNPAGVSASQNFTFT